MRRTVVEPYTGLAVEGVEIPEGFIERYEFEAVNRSSYGNSALSGTIRLIVPNEVAILIPRAIIELTEGIHWFYALEVKSYERGGLRTYISLKFTGYEESPVED